MSLRYHVLFTVVGCGLIAANAEFIGSSSSPQVAEHSAIAPVAFQGEASRLTAAEVDLNSAERAPDAAVIAPETGGALAADTDESS